MTKPRRLNRVQARTHVNQDLYMQSRIVSYWESLCGCKTASFKVKPNVQTLKCFTLTFTITATRQRVQVLNLAHRDTRRTLGRDFRRHSPRFVVRLIVSV